ncbi:hypothetical protein GGX14DRAFT_410413, partial [Mycena pura]
LVFSRLGLALKPRLWLGFGGLWLHFRQAKAQAIREGLAWLWLKPRLARYFLFLILPETFQVSSILGHWSWRV